MVYCGGDCKPETTLCKGEESLGMYFGVYEVFNGSRRDRRHQHVGRGDANNQEII